MPDNAQATPQQQADPYAEFGGSVKTAPSSATTAPPAVDPYKEFGGSITVSKTSKDDDPQQSGYLTNDVGNQVTVPKDGESFSDTMKRAVGHSQSLSPTDRQAEIDKETTPGQLIPKVGEVLGAAMLPALAPDPMAMYVKAIELHGVMDAGIKALVPALTSGVTAVGEWAAAHPIASKAIWETMKLAVYHHALKSGAVAGALRKVVDAAPD
jgi:hypothetical protein